jgi:hypothetical protein
MIDIFGDKFEEFASRKKNESKSLKFSKKHKKWMHQRVHDKSIAKCMNWRG